MKYSNTTIRELTARYSRILRKCALLNAALLLSVAFAVPAMAGIERNEAGEITSIVDNTEREAILTVAKGETVVLAENAKITGNQNIGDGIGGAISTSKPGSGLAGGKLIIKNGSLFQNNTSIYDGGAIGNYGSLEITGATFDSNHAQTGTVDSAPIGGGAISLGIDSNTKTVINGSVFSNNDSGFNGGAIGTRRTLQKGETGENNSLIISDSTFSGNRAKGGVTDRLYDKQTGGNGGAIANTFGTTEINSTEFLQNEAAVNGGAIYNTRYYDVATSAVSENYGGKIVLTDSTFIGNKAGNQGGAVSNSGTISFTGNTVFDGNSAVVGGAISHVDAAGDLTIGDGTRFTNNKADNQAGAVHIQRSNAVLGNNVYFEGNSSGNGGEAHSGGALYVDSDAAKAIKTTIGTGAQFIGNTSSKSAGAIYNYQANDQGSSTIEVGADALFERNTAKANGGAVANYGGIMTLNGATFTGNSADNMGGAIYNDGTMTLNGTFSFSGNTAAGNSNDIHNDGDLTLNGDITLDGGIKGTGSIVFDAGSSLTATLNTTTILANSVTTNGANLNLSIANGMADGTYDFVTANTLDKSFTIGANTLYDITMNSSGQIELAKKSAEEAAGTLAAAGASSNEAAAIVAMSGVSTTGNAQADAVLSQVTTAAQSGDVATASALVESIHPTDAPVLQSVSTNTAVLGAVVNRLAVVGGGAPVAAQGRSGGDVVSKLSPWVQGLYNKTHNSQGIGFDAYSQGFAFGADTDLTDAWTVGLGYAYTATDIKNSAHKTQVYGDNYFIYGQYKPSAWYINGIINYGHSDYKDTGAMTSRYDVDTYGAQIMTGYQWDILDNYAGVRYTYIDVDRYNNGLTEVDTKNSQIATAVIGTKVSKDFTPAKGVVLTPEFRLAGTYDFKADNSKATIGIMGSPASYTIENRRLHRAAVETGVGLTASIRNLELSANYDASLRSESNTQAVNLKAIYHF